MKVVEVSAYAIRISLRKAIKHASPTRTETENLVIRVVLEDGTEGYGEGVPREYVTGESVPSGLDQLRNSQLAAQLEPCRDFASALAAIERFRIAPVPGDDRGCVGNAARCALEIAWLDAYGKSFGEPMCNVTKYLAPEIYRFRTKVQYSGAITGAKGFKAVLAAWKMWGYGFSQVKVKVGIEGYDDVARLRTIRARIGSKMDLRIDANEAWTPAQAIDRIRELEPFRITSAEQPVPHADVAGLKDVRAAVSTPIMLDESLCSYTDGVKAIEGGWCDAFNLRLSKCGGFIPTLRLAQLAKAHNLRCQLGCQVGESAILSAAGRNFACSVADLKYLEGSYDRHLVREALGTTDLTFGWGGWAPAFIASGLSMSVYADGLARVTTSSERLI